MALIGKNIRKIRAFYKLSQTAFAEIFQQKRANIGAWEEERAEPNSATIIQIAKYFKLSIDNFLCKELTINDIANFNLDKIPFTAQQIFATNNSKSNTNIEIPFVSALLFNEFFANFTKDASFENLPKISVPHEYKCDCVFTLSAEFRNKAFPDDNIFNKGNRFSLAMGDLIFCNLFNPSAQLLSGESLSDYIRENTFIFIKQTPDDKKFMWEVVAVMAKV